MERKGKMRGERGALASTPQFCNPRARALMFSIDRVLGVFIATLNGHEPSLHSQKYMSHQDLEPTCRFEGFQRRLEAIWHNFGPLWVCTTQQTQCDTLSICVAPLYFFHCGVALCAPRPSVCVSRSRKRLQSHSKQALASHNDFSMLLYNLELHNDFVCL